MTEENKELRPCPFCGEEARYNDNDEGYECVCLDVIRDKEEWNSAWCWKEIDRLQKLVEGQWDELNKLREAWGDRFLVQEVDAREIERLKSQNQRMREALAEVKMHECTCHAGCGPCFNYFYLIAEEVLKEVKE